MFKDLIAVYPAIFKPEKEGGYFIDFPDLEGVFTGINENDVAFGMQMASEVLGLMLSEFIKNGTKFNDPSPVNSVAHDEDSFVTLVVTDIKKYL